MDSDFEGENSKSAQKHQEVAAGSSGSKHPEITNPTVFHARENSEHFEFYPKVIDRGRSSENSLRHGEVTDGNGDSINSTTTHLGGPITEGDFFSQAKNFRSFSFSSSRSSSVSSTEDLFHVDSNKFNPRACISFSLKSDEDSQQVPKGNIRSPGTESPRISNISHESVLHSMSPTQTPPIQMMDRSGGYDPCRIPSSVFESKSSTPMEWSVASNDSLFSLHVGNGSFSRDQFFVLGDLGKSGELGKPEDLFKSGEFIMFSPPTPAPALEIDRKSVAMEKNSEPTRVVDEPTIDATINTAVEQKQIQVKEKITPQVAPSVSSGLSPTSRFSDGTSSTHSFAFPILTDTGKSGHFKEVEQKQKQQQQQQLQLEQQLQQPESPSPKAYRKSSTQKCLSCFCCCRGCCCCRCSS